VSLLRRERFSTANRTESAVMVGQKILGSGRASIPLSVACRSGVLTRDNSGNAIKAKIHAKIGIIAYLSIIGPDSAGRLNSYEPTEGLERRALAL